MIFSIPRRGVGVGAAPSGYPGRGLYLELGGGERDMSPPSDNVMFDNQCYATTPSSSNGNSDQEPCQRRDPRQHHHAVSIIHSLQLLRRKTDNLFIAG